MTLPPEARFAPPALTARGGGPSPCPDLHWQVWSRRSQPLKGVLPVAGQSPLHGSIGQPVLTARAAHETDACGGLA